MLVLLILSMESLKNTSGTLTVSESKLCSIGKSFSNSSNIVNYQLVKVSVSTSSSLPA